MRNRVLRLNGNRLLAAEQVVCLKLEHRIVQIAAGVVSAQLQNIAGVAHAQAQAAGNLVAQAAQIANCGLFKAIGAGFGRTYLLTAAIFGKCALVQHKAALRTCFEEKAFAGFTGIHFQQHRHVVVAEHDFGGTVVADSGQARGAHVAHAIPRSILLRIQQLSLRRKFTPETVAEQVGGGEARLVFIPTPKCRYPRKSRPLKPSLRPGWAWAALASSVSKARDRMFFCEG